MWQEEVKENVPDCLVKNALQISLCQRRAFQVFLGLDFLRNHDGLLILYGSHLLLPEAFLGGFIVPQIELGTDKNDGYAGRMVIDLRVPLHVC